MHKLIKYGLAVAALLIFGGIISQFGPFSGLDTTNCEWQTLEINGQTFSSVSEFKEAWNQNSETSFSQIQEIFEFRTQDGKVEYKGCPDR
jgi:hypothetical protein